MICFTVFNDRSTYRGFTVGTNKCIGLNYDFCSLIDQGYPAKIPVITSLENRTYFKVAESQVKPEGLILRASLTTTLSEPDAVITDDLNDDDNRETALVHWIVSNQSHYGPIDLSKSLTQVDVYLYKYTRGYLEVLFALKKERKAEITFACGQILNLYFAKGDLHLMNKQSLPAPITLPQEPTS